jgi:hypothetical protein
LSLDITGKALMMEAARTSETLVNFYQTTRHYNPEYSHLHTHRRENLKSYTIKEIHTDIKPNNISSLTFQKIIIVYIF